MHVLNIQKGTMQEENIDSVAMKMVGHDHAKGQVTRRDGTIKIRGEYLPTINSSAWILLF